MRFAVLTAVFAAFAVAQDTASVQGVVVNKVTGAGIDGVTVWLWSGTTESVKAITNEAGVFTFTSLKPGDYNSSVNKAGYTDPSPVALLPVGDPPKLHIGAASQPVRLRFELNPPASLRGRVLDADGNPGRASVELGPGRIVKTDADGSFAFENLSPGSYFLLARPQATHHADSR